jgi:hypothetical protein
MQYFFFETSMSSNISLRKTLEIKKIQLCKDNSLQVGLYSNPYFQKK